jgi:heat shock protein HslJ/uncharacterized membrane protein
MLPDCQLPVGHNDYCRDCRPCIEGQGDCDNDGECQSGSPVLRDQVLIPDCPGIKYTLTLYRDGTYSESLFYTDRSARAILRSGAFAIDGEMVILDKRDAGMKFFARHPQGLLMLDTKRNIITGDLSAQYILFRKAQYRGTMLNTHTLMRMQEKMKEGIDFYALGSEPSWSLDIDFDKFMRFRSLTAIPELNTPPGREATAQDADVTSYRALTEDGMLIVEIFKEPCEDTVSGETYPLKVRVDAKYTADTDYLQFEGCGRYVVDYRLNDIWVLTTFNQQPLKGDDFAKGLPVVEFHLIDNRVFGSTGCNRISGGFEAKGKTITFSQMATTRMACPNMAFEQDFLKAITRNTLNYALDKGKLILTNDEGVQMDFKKTD